MWPSLAQVWRVVRPFVFVVALVQVISLLWVIWIHSPTTPYRDEWWYVNLVAHANAGSLTFNDFWALHYHTHRIVIPRAIDLSLIELTHWNRQVMMTFDLALGVASGALLFVSALRSLKSRSATLALVIPLSLLALSWAQFENWLEPFQLAFIATAFGAVLTLCALQTDTIGWKRFAIAVLGALIATFSSAAGLVVWIAFLPSLTQAGYRRLLLWTGIVLGVGIAYLYGFTNQFSRPSLLSIPPFVLAYLGAPVATPHAFRSVLVGLFGLVFVLGNVVIYWLLTRSLHTILGWIGLALFALGTAVLAVDGRGTNGIYGGMTSRYQSFGALFWVAAIVICAVVLQRVGSHLAIGKLAFHPALARGIVALNIVTIIAVTGSAALANWAGLRAGIAQQAYLVRNQDCIVHYETAPDSCLVMWYPTSDKQTILDAAAYLKAHKLAIFYTGSK